MNDAPIMKVLVVDDDEIMRLKLEKVLTEWGYHTTLADSGEAALKILRSPEPPRIVLLDWMMPGISGLEVCRELATDVDVNWPHIIMLSVKDEKCDIVEALGAGAGDYIVKPFDTGELKARVNVGNRIVWLTDTLSARVGELEDALNQLKILKGLLPICAACKKVRDDKGYWTQIEHYISEHTEAEFTHSMCPECNDQYYHKYLNNDSKEKK